MSYFLTHAKRRNDHLAACQKRRQGGSKQRATRKTSGGDKPLPPGADRHYGAHLSVLEEQLASLRTTYPDHAERNQHKPKILADYMPVVDAFIEAGGTHQNDILIHLIITACDVGNWDTAIRYADYANTHQMTSPEGWDRNMVTFVADAIRIAHADVESAAIKQKDAIQPFDLPPQFFQVLNNIESGDWDVHFTAQCKNQKMAGVWAEANGEWADAVKYYTAANRDKTRGVKARLDKAQAALTAEASTVSE